MLKRLLRLAEVFSLSLKIQEKQHFLLLVISSWPMLICTGDAQARGPCFSSMETWLTLFCCRQHKVPANSVSFLVPFLLKVSEGRKRRIKLKRWNEENHKILRLGSFSTKLPSWGDLDGLLPVFLQFLTFVVAAFCRARPSVLLRSGWFKEHLIFSAHQSCTYQPSSTNKHCWGIWILHMGDIIGISISKHSVLKALTESFIWNEMGTAGSREHCSSSSQDFYRFGILPHAYQCLLFLKNMPDEFREHWLQRE